MTCALTHGMYEIWAGNDNHRTPGPKFRNLKDALAFTRSYAAGESVSIKCPDGTWHQFENGTAYYRNRRRSPRIRLNRRVSLQRRHSRDRIVGAVIENGTVDGLGIRIVDRASAFPTGTVVNCQLSSSYDSFTVVMKVVWEQGRRRGLARMDCDAADTARMDAWLRDWAGANTPPWGLRAIAASAGEQH